MELWVMTNLDGFSCSRKAVFSLEEFFAFFHNTVCHTLGHTLGKGRRVSAGRLDSTSGQRSMKIFTVESDPHQIGLFGGENRELI